MDRRGRSTWLIVAAIAVVCGLLGLFFLHEAPRGAPPQDNRASTPPAATAFLPERRAIALTAKP